MCFEETGASYFNAATHLDFLTTLFAKMCGVHISITLRLVPWFDISCFSTDQDILLPNMATGKKCSQMLMQNPVAAPGGGLPAYQSPTQQLLQP